jgi:hypothetical protein
MFQPICRRIIIIAPQEPKPFWYNVSFWFAFTHFTATSAIKSHTRIDHVLIWSWLWNGEHPIDLLIIIYLRAACVRHMATKKIKQESKDGRVYQKKTKRELFQWALVFLMSIVHCLGERKNIIVPRWTDYLSEHVELYPWCTHHVHKKETDPNIGQGLHASFNMFSLSTIRPTNPAFYWKQLGPSLLIIHILGQWILYKKYPYQALNSKWPFRYTLKTKEFG